MKIYFISESKIFLEEVHFLSTFCGTVDFRISKKTILLGGFFFGQTILSLQGASGQALDYANDYYPIMLVGSVFMVFAVFFRSILSGEGDNRMPMIILGIGTIINIVLDPILEVMIIIVFLKSIVRPKLSVILPSSRTCRRTL